MSACKDGCAGSSEKQGGEGGGGGTFILPTYWMHKLKIDILARHMCV